MKRKILTLMLCMAAAFATAACAGAENESTQAAEETEQESATLTYDGERSAQMDIDLEKQITTLSDYNGIDVTITGNYNVTDEDVETSALQLLSYYDAGTVEVTDRDTVQDGDYVMIDYVGYKDDEAFDGGSASDVMMDVSNNTEVSSQSSYIDGFCDDIVGAKVGDELNTDVTFPEDYAASEELAGQPAVFKITVKGIYEPVTIDTLTDDAVADVFTEYGISTKDDLLAYVQYVMESQAASYKAQAIMSAVQSYVLEHSEVEIPQEYMDARMAELEYSTALDNCSEGQTLAEFLEENGTSLEEVRESWEESLTEQIKVEFLFGRIADLEEIEIDEDELEEFIDNLMSVSSTEFEDTDALYEYYGIGSKEDGEQEIRKLCRINKAINYVAENANVTVEENEETQE